MCPRERAFTLFAELLPRWQPDREIPLQFKDFSVTLI